MRERVRHLEGLVKGVIGDVDVEGKREEGQGRGESRGNVVVDERVGESTYVGATHWAAILEDVCFSLSLSCPFAGGSFFRFGMDGLMNDARSRK